MSQSPTPPVMSHCRGLVGPIPTWGGSRCRVWSEMGNTDNGRVCPIIRRQGQLLVSMFTEPPKKSQCCRTHESFRVFSVMWVKSSFTTASERIPCLGFIKRISCQNREPDWGRISALPSLSPEQCPLWQKWNGCGMIAVWRAGYWRTWGSSTQAAGWGRPCSSRWALGTVSSWQPSVGFTALRVRRSGWRNCGVSFISDILGTLTVLGIRNKLQALKGNKCIIQTRELCHEGSCEPQLVGSHCRVPSPITCLWNLLAWGGKCYGSTQESFSRGEGLPMSLEENTASCFSVQAKFFTHFQQTCLCV